MSAKFDELSGANALIEKIERMYPNWHKFRDLAEAIQVHTENQDNLIKGLEAKVDELMGKLHPKSRIPEKDYYQYIATITGGIGPDVWDNEMSIFAPNISEAVRLIEEGLKGDAAIVSIQQAD